MRKGLFPTDDYITTHLSLSRTEAIELHRRYYTDYGLALSGLVLHHKIDPLDYNEKVDDALPLDTVITPDPHLRKLLEDIDKSKVKLWLFTNAYVTHAKRIVRLLGVEDLFEGITYCDYAKMPFVCKPHREMFAKAEAEAQAPEIGGCYFVGMYIYGNFFLFRAFLSYHPSPEKLHSPSSEFATPLALLCIAILIIHSQLTLTLPPPYFPFYHTHTLSF